MGKFLIVFVLLLVATIGGAMYLFSPQSESAPPKVELPDVKTIVTTEEDEQIVDGVYMVNAGDTITWSGRKTLVADYVHTGTFEVSSGTVNVNGEDVSGEFVFDMTTITSVSSPSGDPSAKTASHLKNEDFFDAETYPTSTFTLKSLTPVDGQEGNYTVVGDMKIKDITNEISFPSVITMQEGNVRFVAQANLDRTEWDIRFGSDKFFDNLANNVIDDYFTINMDLVAVVQ